MTGVSDRGSTPQHSSGQAASNSHGAADHRTHLCPAAQSATPGKVQLPGSGSVAFIQVKHMEMQWDLS